MLPGGFSPPCLPPCEKIGWTQAVAGNIPLMQVHEFRLRNLYEALLVQWFCVPLGAPLYVMGCGLFCHTPKHNLTNGLHDGLPVFHAERVGVS